MSLQRRVDLLLLAAAGIVIGVLAWIGRTANG